LSRWESWDRAALESLRELHVAVRHHLNHKTFGIDKADKEAILADLACPATGGVPGACERWLLGGRDPVRAFMDCVSPKLPPAALERWSRYEKLLNVRMNLCLACLCADDLARVMSRLLPGDDVPRELWLDHRRCPDAGVRRYGYLDAMVWSGELLVMIEMKVRGHLDGRGRSVKRKTGYAVSPGQIDKYANFAEDVIPAPRRSLLMTVAPEGYEDVLEPGASQRAAARGLALRHATYEAFHEAIRSVVGSGTERNRMAVEQIRQVSALARPADSARNSLIRSR
jgi:hypothetical protein